MKLESSEANKTIALAGIFQAVHLVNQAAFGHVLNDAAYMISIESIFKINLADVPSLFGNADSIKLGLYYLVYYNIASPTIKEEKVLLRYLLFMSKLARVVLTNQTIFQHLHRRLEPIILQAQHLGSSHEIVIRELALLYRQVFISRGLEIPVLGKRSCFNNLVKMNKIYALLLAGIRASVLWYQVGGSRFQLLFSRTRLKKQAIILLNHEWQSLST